MKNNPHYPIHLRRFPPVLSALLLCALPLLAACSNGKPTSAAAPKKEAAGIPVTAGVITQRTIPVELKAVGTAEPLATVGIKSQVTGQIEGKHFTEGQEVKQGALLFSIDPGPFENALHGAEATLAASKARLANAREALAVAERTLATDRKRGEAALEAAQAHADDARAKAERVKALLAGKLVSQEESETAGTAVVAAASDLRQAQVKLEELDNQHKSLELQRQAIVAAAAQVSADEVSLDGARLQLGYCSIRAPLAGRTGSLMTDKGNLVKANDVDMVVINQIQPINVSFSVPEQYLNQVRQLMEGGGKLPVQAIIAGAEDRPVAGVLSFVDNAVDNTSGTIRLKGHFPNADRLLWPGQFVNVVLTLGLQKGAVIAPAGAIQTGQGGQYVFVIKDDQTVESRPVTVDHLIDQEAVVTKGLTSGERVVTDGQLRLSPGVKVEIKKSAAAR